MRQALRWMALLVLPLFCTACWDSTDIDKLAILTASGFDTPKRASELPYRPADTKSDQQAEQSEGAEDSDDGGNGTSQNQSSDRKPTVLVTGQFARPSDLGTAGGGGAPSASTGTTKTFVLEQAQGENVMNAAEKIGKRLSRKLFLGHRRAVILGEDYAKQGVSDLMDEVIRNPTARLRTYIVVAYHSRAEDIMKLPYPFDRLPSEAIASIERGGAVAEVDAKSFVRRLADEGIDPFAMGIQQVQTLHNVSGKMGKSFDLNCIALFRDDKLVGWLSTPEQMRGFYWMQGTLKRESATVHIPQAGGSITMRLLSLRSSFTPSFVDASGGQAGGNISSLGVAPRMKVQIQAQFDVLQNGTSLVLTKPADMQKLREAMQQEIDRQVRSTLMVLQQQYQSDPLGFGRKFHQRYPRQWRQMRENWPQVYKTMQVTVAPVVRIRSSGLVQQKLHQISDTE